MKHLYDNEPMEFTAYETQELTATNVGRLEYIRFTVGDEPVPCEAIFHRNSEAVRVMYLDSSCFTATYTTQILSSAKTFSTFSTLGSIMLVLALFGGMFVIVRHRNQNRESGYRNIRFAISTGSSQDTSSGNNQAEATAIFEKGYNTVRV